MAFEAYSVAVKLSLINHVSSGLALISKGLVSTGTDVDKLNGKLASIGKQAAIGGAMMAGGMGLAAMFKAPIDAAREYELAYTKFRTINLGPTINAQADNFARSANVLGVSAKDLMSSLSESVGLFGSFDLAKKLTPQIAALNAANSAIFAGKVGHIDEGSTRSLLKFIDRRGGTHDEGTFMRNLDLAQKMVTGSGGFIKFRDLDQFSQMGGTAFRGLSDEGIYNMALLLQEQGGAKAGTSLMSGYQNLIAGRTPKKTMGLLQEYGLGTLSMETHGTMGGKPIKSLVMKDIVGGSIFQADPARWIREFALPAAAKHGITSQADVLKFVNDIFSNRTASNQNSIIGTQQLQLIRDANLAKNAMGAQQTIQAYKDDPNSKFANLGARWNGLLVNLGIAVLPLAITALEKLTPMVSSLAGWIDTNREAVKKFGLGLAIFSGFLVTGGLITMTIAAGRGFLLLGQGLIFLASTAIAPLIPVVARLGTTLLIMGVNAARAATAFVLSSGFVRGALMAFLAPIRLIGTALYYFIAPLGLLLTPIGLVVVGLSVGALLLWNNWKEISGALKLVWLDIKTGVYKLFHGDIGGAFRSFASVFLTLWQTIFNTLIAGANTILPASWQIPKTSFADAYRGQPAAPKNAKLPSWSIIQNFAPKAAQPMMMPMAASPPKLSLVAPVPAKSSVVAQLTTPVLLDGKKIASVVTNIQAKEANRPQNSVQGFDPTRSVLRPGTSSLVVPRN